MTIVKTFFLYSSVLCHFKKSMFNHLKQQQYEEENYFSHDVFHSHNIFHAANL
ncbi:hypothetical protein BOVA711_3250 [Bacteroides ovatus]|nr:hypothetical protein BOVA711_3250 [Bacteroides ovatus]